MTHFFTLQNIGQSSISNVLPVSSIQSILEVYDKKDETFLFTQVKLNNGSMFRVTEELEFILSKILDNNTDTVAGLTIWIEEEGIVPKSIYEIFS